MVGIDGEQQPPGLLAIEFLRAGLAHYREQPLANVVGDSTHRQISAYPGCARTYNGRTRPSFPIVTGATGRGGTFAKYRACRRSPSRRSAPRSTISARSRVAVAGDAPVIVM